MDHFELSTSLRAPAERVWEHATSIEGISFELAPWLKMTVPRGVDREGFGQRMRDGTLPLPAVLGRSWVLLGGVVPFDWDDMRLVEIEPGRRFLERSSTLSFSVWEHERTVSPLPDGQVSGRRPSAGLPDGSLVTDRLAWETRGLTPRGAARAIVSAIFGHRHRRLAARFGRL